MSAGEAQADAADRQALAALQQRLARQVDGLKLELAPHRERASRSFAQADRWRATAADVAEKLFGKRIVYFEADRPLANGIFSTADKARIFLSAKSSKPELAVLGHELTHALRADRPDLYAGLQDGLRAILRNEGEHAAQLNQRRKDRGLDPLRPDSLNEEMLADIVGDHFTEPAFWQALQQAEPGRFHALARRVLEWIDETLSKLSGLRPFQSERFVSDLRKAREVVTRTMAEYSRGEVPEHADGTGPTRRGEADGAERFSLQAQHAAERRLAELPDESRAELLSRKLFDRFNRVLKAQELSGVRGDETDIVMADRLYHGRVQDQGDRLERNFLEPLGKLLRAAREDGVTVRDADDFLMALHAPERNRVIAERNPKMPDGGSGLTTRQAREIVAGFSPAQRQHLDAVARLVHRMNAEKLTAMVDAGLIPAATRDRLQQQYRHYVPLKTLDEEDAARGIGRGYELRANDITAALGRSSKAGSPIAASVMDASRAILRAEKARVDRVVWAFAHKPEGAAFIRPYDAENPPREVMGRKLGPDGQVKEAVDPQKLQELTLQLLVDGEPQRVFVPDELLRDQLRKGATANDPGPVLRAIGKGTGTIGRLLTEFNPAFTLPNAVRDAIAVGMRAGAHGLGGAQVVAGIPRAWKDIVDHRRGRSTEGARRYAEFLEHGGKTGAYGIQGIDDTMHRLERAGAELGYEDRRRSAARKVIDVLGDAASVVSRANEVLEYASRFALYRELRNRGESAQRAAVAARAVTVDFNRSGEWGRTLNSVLVFANAALQGLYGTVAYARSAKVRRNMLGMVALGAAAQLYNELAGGANEETGEPNINSQSDSVADRNLVLLNPGERSGVKVPLPPEYAALYAIGRRLWRAASQGNVAREGAGIVGAVLDGTLPVRIPESSNQAQGLARSVVPTIVSPFADLFVNEDFFGSPIVPERNFDHSPPPAHTISKRSTSDIAKATSELLNSLTGGDDIEPGLAQKKLGPIVSPEGIEHLVKFYTGGLGATAMLTTNMVRGMADDKAHDLNKTPVLNRFAFAEPTSYIGRRYSELEADLGYAQERSKKGQAIDDPRLARALPVFEEAEREIRHLRRSMRDVDPIAHDSVRAAIKREQSRVIRAYNGQPVEAAQ